MNVFEDLLTDLKHDNLLEETVLDEHPGADEFEILGSEDLISDQSPPYTEPAVVTRNDDASSEPAVAKAAINGQEFFKKRAVAEVSSLQMVEHVLTGVEREYMKVKPQAFDELHAKLALNKFLKAADHAEENDDHKSAEFELMQETERWCTALAARDAKVYVSSLRQYCENTKPALSSQALLALCRFYRNLPYSETTRAKYDFLLTRLFTRPTADDQRVCLFKREDALSHLENLYKDWSSVALYSAADDDDSKVTLTALSFDDLARESESASTFDQLIDSDFFSRLRMFKESIAELFFAPQVAIAAIEANVRIGNSYVKLIAAERQKMDAARIQAKYGGIDHDSVSDATARTLQLVELLKAPSPESTASELPPAAHEQPREEKRHREPKPAKKSAKDDGDANEGFIAGLMQNAFAVNKKLLVVSIVLVAATVGLYIWMNYSAEETASTSGVRVVSLDNPVVREHIKTAKVSNDILYGLLDQTWELLPKDKRAEYVKKLLSQGPTLGYTQVNLTTKDGKQAAFGSKERIDIETP